MTMENLWRRIKPLGTAAADFGNRLLGQVLASVDHAPTDNGSSVQCPAPQPIPIETSWRPRRTP